MRIKPNQTLLEGTVRKIVRARDGIGATVEFDVSKNLAADPALDFVGAQPGQMLLPRSFTFVTFLRPGNRSVASP